METLSVDRVEFRIFAAICAVLVLKNLGLAILTGTFRTLRKAFTNPEDARVAGAEGPKTDETVERIRRAHANSTENDYAFMILGLLFLLTGASEVGVQAYGYTYLFARVVHAVAYVFALQPFRTLAFAVGVAAMAGMAVQILMAAFA